MTGLQLSFVLYLLLLPFLGLQAVGSPVVPETCPFCTSSCRNITVSQNGTDGHECLENTNKSCHTLAYALMNFIRTDCVRVTVDYSHPFNESVYLASVSNLAIVGSGDPQPVLHCLTEGSGVSFNTSDNIWIENVAWEGCSLSHKTIHSYTANGTSALFFYQSSNIMVTNCRFSYQRGSSIFMWDVVGNVHVTETSFTNNTTPMYCPASSKECILLGGGLLIEFKYCLDVKFVVSSCYFAHNTDNGTFCQVNQLGNALTLNISSAACIGSTFHITGNIFESNMYSCNNDTHALHAISTLTLEASLYTFGNTILIDNNTYDHNTGVLLSNTNSDSGDIDEGGALGITVSCLGDCSLRYKLIVSRCTFTENSAVAGAVVARITTDESPFNRFGEAIQFLNCSWHSNAANNSGVAVTVFTPKGKIPEISVTFESCQFKMNKITYNPTSIRNLQYNLTAIQHYGALVSEGIPILVAGNTSFENNSITALYLYQSTVNLTGNIAFVNNTSLYGGAVYLDNAAWIILLDNLQVNFENNRARFGGAIYTTFECYNASSTAYCTTFGVGNDGRKMCPDEFPQHTNISFINNTAFISGNAIYLDSRSCPLDCLHGEIFLYHPDDNKEVSAPAIHMQFNEPAVQNILQVSLGQNIFLNITTFTEDPDNHVTVPAVAVATVYLNCGPNSLESVYTLEGPSAVFLENKPFYSNMMMKGPEVANDTQLQLTNQCSLQFVTTGSQPVLEQSLYLDLLPCKFGYVYDSASQMCTCFNSDHIYCNETSLDVCVDYGYWYGQISEDLFTVESCPPSYCKYNYGGCPVGRCGAVPGFCKLPDREDEQCSEDRGGVLCTACRTNYSFTFGAVKCVKSQTCSAAYVLLPVLLMLAFWIAMILSLFLILRLDLRLGSGYFYAFIYYFTVVQYVLPAYLPSEFLEVVITIFVSVTKLDPQFIGQMPVCFMGSVGSIGQQFFQYVHPLIISLAIFITILLARFFPRLPNPAKNSAIHSICILMLLSFSSLVETSFNLLKPVKFEQSSDVFIKIEADTVYFDPKKHLPFALVAILVLVVIIFPFMFFLYLSPFLVRHGFNLTKFKPILDEYQSCYKDKWRWVAGNYFLWRIIVFFVFMFDIGVYGNIYILQIFFMFAFGFHAVIQPYSANWLNNVDAIFLLDLTIISMLYGSTADSIFSGNAQIVREIILHILILIPCFYFAGFIIYLLLSRTKLKKWIQKKDGRNVTSINWSISPSTTSSVTDNSVPSVVYDDCDREPLLALLSDNGAPTAAKYQAVHRQEQQESFENIEPERANNDLQPSNRSSQTWQQQEADVDDSDYL